MTSVDFAFGSVVTVTLKRRSKPSRIALRHTYQDIQTPGNFPHSTYRPGASSFLIQPARISRAIPSMIASTTKSLALTPMSVINQLLSPFSPTNHLARILPPHLIDPHRRHLPPPITSNRRNLSLQGGRGANPSSAHQLIRSPASGISEAVSGTHVLGVPVIYVNAKAARFMSVPTASLQIRPANARIARRIICAPIA